jgi:fumarate hydratase class II
MANKKTRTVHDSMGDLEIPENALWGAQTQRAIQNFPISGLTMPRRFIQALGLIKAACARANVELGHLQSDLASEIITAAEAVAAGEHDEHFPIDVFQTGSGTSSNMNANEVIAEIASRGTNPVHPNDHVNMGQSSNDVVPTAIHLSAAMAVDEVLLPALGHLAEVIEQRAEALAGTVTTGRTHLMDAMPVTLGQVLGGWTTQVRNGIARIEATLPRIHALAQGGTAVGTGINADPEFGTIVARILTERMGIPFETSPDKFESLSSQDAAVELSGQLKTIAVSLMKIANDLRLMNSGPLAGIGEITLPALQPGSSIMPGKVNPVIPEAACMVAAQVIGNDATITIGGQAGNFQLNVMLPVIAYNLIQSIEILANVSNLLADSAIDGFEVNDERLKAALEGNPILVTALNPVIGYELGAAIAKRAYDEGRPVKAVAKEMTELSDEELDRLLDPKSLAEGGIIKEQQ